MISEITTLARIDRPTCNRIAVLMEEFVKEQRHWAIRTIETERSDGSTAKESIFDIEGKLRVTFADQEKPWFRITIWDQRNALIWAVGLLTILAENGVKWISISAFGKFDWPEKVTRHYGEEYDGDLSGLLDRRVLTTLGCLRFIIDLNGSGIFGEFQSLTAHIDQFAQICKSKLPDPSFGFDIARSMIAGIKEPNFFLLPEELREKLQ